MQSNMVASRELGSVFVCSSNGMQSLVLLLRNLVSVKLCVVSMKVDWVMCLRMIGPTQYCVLRRKLCKCLSHVFVPLHPMNVGDMKLRPIDYMTFKSQFSYEKINKYPVKIFSLKIYITVF